MSFCVAWDICAYLQACLNRSEFTCEKNMGLCSPHFKAEKMLVRQGIWIISLSEKTAPHCSLVLKFLLV